MAQMSSMKSWIEVRLTRHRSQRYSKIAVAQLRSFEIHGRYILEVIVVAQLRNRIHRLPQIPHRKNYHIESWVGVVEAKRQSCLTYTRPAEATPSCLAIFGTPNRRSF